MKALSPALSFQSIKSPLLALSGDTNISSAPVTHLPLTLRSPCPIENPHHRIRPISKDAPFKNSTTSEVKENATTSDILRLMDGLHLPVSSDMYDSLIRECTVAGDSFLALELHSHIKRSRVRPSLNLMNRLLLMQVSCGNLGAARKLFDQMAVKDLNSWASMILAYLDAGKFEDAIETFWEMEYCNLMWKIPGWLLVYMLKVCMLTENVELGKQLHGQFLKLGINDDVSPSGSLIEFYGKFGYPEDANLVFDKLTGQQSFHWTAKMVNNCRERLFHKVIYDFNEMGREGVNKNGFTFSIAIKACSKMDDCGWSGRQVHASVIKHGFESDVYVQCGLVTMYGKCRLPEDAERAFQMIGDEKNDACWNAMLVTYVHNTCCGSAVKFLYLMKESGIKVEESLIKGVREVCTCIT